MNLIIFSETCGTGNIDENEIGCPETNEMEIDSDLVNRFQHQQHSWNDCFQTGHMCITT